MNIGFLLIFLSLLPIGVKAMELKIALGGTEFGYEYTSTLLSRALKAEGYDADFTHISGIPTPRLEVMMSDGDICCFILGKTEDRNKKFLAIDIGMTNNLFGHRILFIRKGTQSQYDNVNSLEDFRLTEKIAGMGSSWGDVQVWQQNNLRVQTIEGDWKNLYRMVYSGSRNVDYLTRGAQEMIQDSRDHPELSVEQNLVLVYQKDHIMYVSPKKPELYEILRRVLKKADEIGLIVQVAKEFYPEVYEEPINLSDRRVIELSTPN